MLLVDDSAITFTTSFIQTNQFIYKYNFVAYVSTELMRHEYNLISFNVTDVQEQTYTVQSVPTSKPYLQLFIV